MLCRRGRSAHPWPYGGTIAVAPRGLGTAACKDKVRLPFGMTYGRDEGDHFLFAAAVFASPKAAASLILFVCFGQSAAIAVQASFTALPKMRVEWLMIESPSRLNTTTLLSRETTSLPP